MWRIGPFAQATGLTIRALHHYEQMGLLAPGRTSSGHRVYQTHDLQRIFKILALKDLGLSLEEIKHTLAHDQTALDKVLAELLQKTKEELKRLTHLKNNLEVLQPLLEQKMAPEDLLKVIASLSHIERHIARQKSPAQGAEAKWRALGEALRKCMLTHTPHAKQTQIVTAQIVIALQQFSGGNENVLEALATLRQFAPPQDLAGWDPPLFQFLDSALKTYTKGS